MTNLPTLLTEAAMKGMYRRAKFGVTTWVKEDRVPFVFLRKSKNPYDDTAVIFEGTAEECHAFIEREGLRASMAWLAEKWSECDGLMVTAEDGSDLYNAVRNVFKALAGCGEG